MTYILHRTPCCRYTWEQKHGKNNNIPVETKLVCKYMVDTDNLNITLRTTYNNGNDFVSMEIDGRLLENNTMPVNYNFEKAGEHIVKYELKDSTILGYNAPCFYTPDLVEVIIPDGVTEIKSSVFNNCNNLTKVVIPKSVINIGSFSFVNCGITNIEIKNGHIGMLAFANCSYLTEVLIDDDVTEIGPVAFHYCTGLTNVSIGTGITSIGGSAFQACSSLASLTIKATTPPTLGDSFVFLTPNCPIYVPSESVNTYKAAEYWSTYADRIQAIS